MEWLLRALLRPGPLPCRTFVSGCLCGRVPVCVEDVSVGLIAEIVIHLTARVCWALRWILREGSVEIEAPGPVRGGCVDGLCVPCGAVANAKWSHATSDWICFCI